MLAFHRLKYYSVISTYIAAGLLFLATSIIDIEMERQLLDRTDTVQYGTIPSENGTEKLLDNAFSHFINEIETNKGFSIEKYSTTLNVESWSSSTPPEDEDLIYYYPEIGGYSLYDAFMSDKAWGDIAVAPADNIALYPILPVAYPTATSWNDELRCANYRLGDTSFSLGGIFNHVELWTIQCQMGDLNARGNIYLSVRSNPTLGILGDILTYLILLFRAINFVSYMTLVVHTFKNEKILIPVGPLQYIGSQSHILNVLDVLAAIGSASAFFKYDRMFFMERSPFYLRFSAVFVMLKVFSTMMMLIDHLSSSALTSWIYERLRKTENNFVGVQLTNLLRPELSFVIMLYVCLWTIERINALTLTSGVPFPHADLVTPVLDTQGLCETGHAMILFVTCLLAALSRLGLSGLAAAWSLRKSSSVMSKKTTPVAPSGSKKGNSLIRLTGSAACVTYGKHTIATTLGDYLTYEAVYAMQYFRMDSTNGTYYSKSKKKHMEIRQQGQTVIAATEATTRPPFLAQFNRHVGITG